MRAEWGHPPKCTSIKKSKPERGWKENAKLKLKNEAETGVMNGMFKNVCKISMSPNQF